MKKPTKIRQTAEQKTAEAVEEARRQAIAEMSRRQIDKEHREVLGHFCTIVVNMGLPDQFCISGVHKVGNELRGLSIPAGDLKRVGDAVAYMLDQYRHG